MATTTTTTTTVGRTDNDDSMSSIPVTRATYFFVLCASINSCNLGYDIGVSTTAAKVLQDDWGLSDIQRELFVGSINFWAIFGALLAQHVTDVYGRRKTFLTSAIVFITGVLFMSFSGTYSMLMFGRFLVGLGVGVGLAIDPLYIAEISPANHRGRLVTYAEIALNIGIVFGFSGGLFFGNLGTSAQWRTMFLCGAILPIVMIVLVQTIMPESPRWLVSNERIDEAVTVLRQIYPQDYDTKKIVYDIQESIQRDKQAEHGAIGWSIIRRPTPGFQRMLLVGISMAISQQAIGIDAIQYYLLDVIDEAGYGSSQRQSIVLIMLGLIKLCFVIVGGRLFDTYGRRPLILTSLLGCATSLLIISICFAISPSVKSTVVILALSIYLAFFSIGMGPGGWLIPSEVFTFSIRGPAMSIATMSNRITATLMSSTFLSTASAIGWASFFFLLFVICLLVAIFMNKYLPETRNKSLEDMSIYFAEITNDITVLEAEELVRGGAIHTDAIDSNGTIQLPNRINDQSDNNSAHGLT